MQCYVSSSAYSRRDLIRADDVMSHLAVAVYAVEAGSYRVLDLLVLQALRHLVLLEGLMCFETNTNTTSPQQQRWPGKRAYRNWFASGHVNDKKAAPREQTKNRGRRSACLRTAPRGGLRPCTGYRPAPSRSGLFYEQTKKKTYPKKAWAY